MKLKWSKDKTRARESPLFGKILNIHNKLKTQDAEEVSPSRYLLENRKKSETRVVTHAMLVILLTESLA